MTPWRRTLNNEDLCFVDDFVWDYMGVYWGSTLETLWGSTEGLLGVYSGGLLGVYSGGLLWGSTGVLQFSGHGL